MKISEYELLYQLKSTLFPFEPERTKPISVLVFVQAHHCDVCKQDAQPYWSAMATHKQVDFRIFFLGKQPRASERFAGWMELPKQYVIPVATSLKADSVLWAFTAPAVVVIDNQTKQRLVHIGSSRMRRRSILFYELLIQYLNERFKS